MDPVCMNMCMCVCMYACMHVCMQRLLILLQAKAKSQESSPFGRVVSDRPTISFVSRCVCMHVCMFASMYVCMYVDSFTCIILNTDSTIRNDETILDRLAIFQNQRSIYQSIYLSVNHFALQSAQPSDELPYERSQSDRYDHDVCKNKRLPELFLTTDRARQPGSPRRVLEPNLPASYVKLIASDTA